MSKISGDIQRGTPTSTKKSQKFLTINELDKKTLHVLNKALHFPQRSTPSTPLSKRSITNESR